MTDLEYARAMTETNARDYGRHVAMCGANSCYEPATLYVLDRPHRPTWCDRHAPRGGGRPEPVAIVAWPVRLVPTTGRLWALSWSALSSIVGPVTK